jgi:hypothetical protein
LQGWKSLAAIGRRAGRSAAEGVLVDVPSRWQVLESCPAVDESVWIRHATGFAAAFIVPAKRERWRELLTRRPRRLSRDSHKLRSDLDPRTCRLLGERPPADLRGEGVFYGFGDGPRVIPADLAAVAAGGGDAIFSLVPGELALYFFHEDEVWVCRAGPKHA